MNIRFSPDSVRIRVLRVEFEKLRAERVLEASTRFPSGGALVYEVRAAGTDFRLEWKDDRITLFVPESELERIAREPLKKDSGAEFTVAREGGEELSVSFEVDLFSAKKRPSAGT